MRRLIFYDPTVVTHPTNHEFAGVRAFSGYSRIYNPKVVPIDRTGTITFPVHVESLFPMPKFRPINKTYEDICNERAVELLKHADDHQLPVRVFYSGGIDSTLVTVSLIKNATPAQKENITILMSEESIAENPNFYKEHIRGKLKTDSSVMFPNVLGQKCLIVNGEHNDQLIGSDAVGALIRSFGPDVVHQPYDRALFAAFFGPKLGNESDTNLFLDLFEKLKNNAPVPIETNYDYLWWINFALKWQTVSMRLLPFTPTRNTGKIDRDYFFTNYMPFYRTEDFQLWSMNNRDKRMKESWNSYKWVSKEVIYDFTKDAEYRDTKQKKGSLKEILLQQTGYEFIDDQFRFEHEIDFKEIHNPKNDFVDKIAA